MIRLLLTGINYTGTQSQLRGCLNDASNIDALLSQYEIAEKIILLEQEATKANILAALASLISKSQEGDKIFFHYSGHGTQVPDRHGDEIDGMDEALVPYDYASGGLIIDDELYNVFRNLVPGAHLVVLLDCCHSGDSTKDFSLDYKKSRSVTLFEAPSGLPINSIKQVATEINLDATMGNMILLSGCQSDQTSADAFINETFQGAFTFALTNLLKQTPNLTYRNLCLQLNEVMNMMGFEQNPQLYCSEEHADLEIIK
jgi:hypothetical protein